MRFRRFISALSLIGCGSSARLSADAATGPTLVVPAHFAEREAKEKPGAPAPSATLSSAAPGASAVPGAPPAKQDPPPDPPALVTPTQWLYRFSYSKGAIAITSVARKEFGRPIATERKVGRFAVELWVGHELIERVRFDFPLLGADPAPAGEKRSLRETPAFGPGAETSREVLVPASDRATRAVLVDRQSGHETPLPWPPDAAEPAKTAPSPE
jgi:hypothetical protein